MTVGERGRVLLRAAASATLAWIVTSACGAEDKVDCYPAPTPTPMCGYTAGDGECGGYQYCPYPAPDYCRHNQVVRCADAGRCFQVVKTCAIGEDCVNGACVLRSSVNVDVCNSTRAAYEKAITPAPTGPLLAVVRPGLGFSPGQYGPGCPGDCRVSRGHCELATCWFIGDRPPEVDGLARLYVQEGCPPAVSPCDCAPLASVSCQVIQDPNSNRSVEACVVE